MGEAASISRQKRCVLRTSRTHEFDLTLMVETMGRCDTPKESIEKLFRVKQMHSSSQFIGNICMTVSFFDQVS